MNEAGSDGARGPDWVTIIVTLAGLGWSGWYVWSTRNNPFDEPEAAWLITPLFLALCLTGPFVLASALPSRPKRLHADSAESLAPPERWRFVLSLPILAGLVWALGFGLAVSLYLPMMTWVLGERRLGRLAVITVGVLLVILLGFSWGLGVNLPLWPRSLS